MCRCQPHCVPICICTQKINTFSYCFCVAILLLTSIQIMMMREKKNIHWNVVRKDGVCCEWVSTCKRLCWPIKKANSFCNNSSLTDRASQSVSNGNRKTSKKETGTKGQWWHFAPMASMIESRLAITSSSSERERES